MRRLLKALLGLNSLRKALGFGKFFAAIKFDLRLRLVEKFSFKNVLILSPHPDDDSFGMGGSIKKMTSNGVNIVVAYFCDGSGGVPTGRKPGAEVGIDLERNPDLIKIRRTEAETAAEILGISETIFWGYPDGKLASSSSPTKALEDLILKVKPDIIFLPSFLDNHPDHRVVNEIFINASKVLPENFPVWAYEIWTPIFINRLIETTLYIKTKQEAILAHSSQMQSRRYDKAIVGLNQYRAEINNIQGFAEGFFIAPIKIYRELYRKS